ncbi:MAG: hypothetical protein WDN25_08885 [Acetobacteraceae bacterium]
MQYKANVTATLLICLLASAACTRPAVTPKPPGFQDQADALRDWMKVAGHIADDMTRYGFLPDPASQAAFPTANGAPYYIYVSNEKSPFLHEVAQSLKAEILRRGGAVARSPVGAAAINLDLSLVRWPPRRGPPTGAATAAGLAAGTALLLANQAPLTPAAGFGLLAGAGLLVDAALALTPNTDTEIAWEASILSGDRIVFSVRYPMYIANADRDLYLGEPQIVGPPLVQVRYRP